MASEVKVYCTTMVEPGRAIVYDMHKTSSEFFTEARDWELVEKSALDTALAELSAYKKAKAENDERFQLEIGELKYKLTKAFEERDQARDKALELGEIVKRQQRQLPDVLEKLQRYEKALRFYAYKAVVRTEVNGEAAQYWSDAGIWDHGNTAKDALEGE